MFVTLCVIKESEKRGYRTLVLDRPRTRMLEIAREGHKGRERKKAAAEGKYVVSGHRRLLYLLPS